MISEQFSRTLYGDSGSEDKTNQTVECTARNCIGVYSLTAVFRNADFEGQQPHPSDRAAAVLPSKILRNVETEYLDRVLRQRLARILGL